MPLSSSSAGSYLPLRLCSGYASLLAGQDLFAGVIPAIRNNLEGLGVERAPRLLGHVRKLASVVAYVGHLMGHDEMVLRIHGVLNIITDNPLPRPLVVIERASESVREICLSSVCINWVFNVFRRCISWRSVAIFSLSRLILAS